MNAARSAVGTPYSWGGSSLGGMDCSGLVNYAYQAAGISLPRTSGQIANGGRWISQSQAQPGDIVVGTDTRETVQARLGSPSAVSTRSAAA